MGVEIVDGASWGIIGHGSRDDGSRDDGSMCGGWFILMLVWGRTV